MITSFLKFSLTYSYVAYLSEETLMICHCAEISVILSELKVE
jgi:hypothetical protein